MADHHATATSGQASGVWLTLLAGLLALYLIARLLRQRGSPWPWYRSFLWSIGLLIASLAVVGPIATRAHSDFRWHMVSHLLLGMLVPIALVLAAPITLTLTALPVTRARQVVRLLNTPFLRLVSHPVPATIFNVGGLWVLYTTDLYSAMHRSWVIGLLVHLHIVIAGYLFTAAMIGREPVRHRPSWLSRAVVLIAAMAAHAILAKYLYSHPPAGVDAAQARTAGQIMYYGGDAIDSLLITIFCWQWFRAAQPRIRPLAPSETVAPVRSRLGRSRCSGVRAP